MSVINEPIKVTAAVIRDGEKVLICKRPAGKRHGGLWEFPGGKVEPGETLFDCIIRECREELSITLRPIKTITAIENGGYEITFIECEIASGVLTLNEHEEFRWISTADTAGLEFCPTDKQALAAIFSNE
jgi:mutator protein MutT